MFRIVKDECMVSLQIGTRVGVNFKLFWKDYEGNPYYHFALFIWGTFLGRNPHTDHRCCSNGITIISFDYWGFPFFGFEIFGYRFFKREFDIKVRTDFRIGPYTGTCVFNKFGLVIMKRY